MKVTYYGHSCFMVEVNGEKLLFDPFITPNELAREIDISTIQPDYILVSHGHADHVADLETIANSSNATVVCSFELEAWLHSKDIKNTHSMNHGGEWTFDFGVVKCVAAVHSSSLPDGTYGGNPLGFVIRSDEGAFYFAGDTAVTLDMQLIPRTNKIDFAFLPIGSNYTMGIDDAVVAAEFIKCDRIVPMHYNTFDWIKIDIEEAKRKFNVAGDELIVLNIGETREI